MDWFHLLNNNDKLFLIWNFNIEKIIYFNSEKMNKLLGAKNVENESSPSTLQLLSEVDEITTRTNSLNSSNSVKSNVSDYWIKRAGKVRPITEFVSISDILNYSKTKSKMVRLEEAKLCQEKFLKSIKGSGDIHYITRASFQDVFSRQVNNKLS